MAPSPCLTSPGGNFPTGKGNHRAAAAESVRGIECLPERIIHRKNKAVQGAVRRAGAPVHDGGIAQIGPLLLCLLLALPAPGGIRRHDVLPENEIEPGRVALLIDAGLSVFVNDDFRPPPAFLLQRRRNFLCPALPAPAFLQGRGQGFADIEKHVVTGHARHGEHPVVFFLPDLPPVEGDLVALAFKVFDRLFRRQAERGLQTYAFRH